MAKTVKKKKESNPAETISRDEQMKQPGWSNTLPGSPAATKATKTAPAPEEINNVSRV
jgi:hypothetical protein